MNKLRERILEISVSKGLSHIGSNLSAVEIIDSIYASMGEKDIFVLSSGHAGLALYTVLEKYKGIDAEKLFDESGVHATRNSHIFCSTGSLGHGLPIALGAALADISRSVYCLISDGECMEGSVWETLRLARDLDAQNLIVFINANGYGGYSEINLPQLKRQIDSFGFPCMFIHTNMEPLAGLKAHYEKITG